MLIDWAHFTPIAAVSGGGLIGLAVAILLMFNGKIAGISGIFSNALIGDQRNWRLAFLLGLILSPTLWQWMAPLPIIQVKADFSTMIIAGLLVGFGTRLGSGCTSGHGVCGLARLSKRSIVATSLFMLLGFLTTFVVRHAL